MPDGISRDSDVGSTLAIVGYKHVDRSSGLLQSLQSGWYERDSRLQAINELPILRFFLHESQLQRRHNIDKPSQYCFFTWTDDLAVDRSYRRCDDPVDEGRKLKLQEVSSCEMTIVATISTTGSSQAFPQGFVDLLVCLRDNVML